MPTPGVSTTPVSPVCPECGIVQKSGKMSCCGRGGSWYGNCGGAGNAILEHMWHEGIQVCTARQSRTVLGQQLQASEPQRDDSFNNGSIGIRPKVVIVAVHLFTSTPINALRPISGATAIPVATSTPIATAARKSVTYDTGTTAKAITVTTTKIVHFALSTLTSKPLAHLTIMPSGNGTNITLPANLTMIFMANSTIMTLASNRMITLLISTSNNLSVNTTIFHPVNATIYTPCVNSIIISLSINPAKLTSSHTPDSSASTTAKECEKLLYLISQIIMMFITVC